MRDKYERKNNERFSTDAFNYIFHAFSRLFVFITIPKGRAIVYRNSSKYGESRRDGEKDTKYSHLLERSLHLLISPS